jgi:hypothetical protein
MLIVSRLLAVLLLASVGVAGCGASRPGPAVSSPFTERDKQLFDDGFDLMEDPDALHCQWRIDWEHELTERLDRSDAIVEGEIVSTHVDTDPDQRKSYRVVLSVRKAHRGALGHGVNEVSLAAREGSLGYASLAGNPERILRLPFVAFMKYADVAGRPVAHFHLTPPSLALRRALAELAREDKK